MEEGPHEDEEVVDCVDDGDALDGGCAYEYEDSDAPQEDGVVWEEVQGSQARKCCPFA